MSRLLPFLLAFSIFLPALSALANTLVGDYRGKIKIGSLPLQDGVLYIREVLVDQKNSSLIAVLAAQNPDGTIGNTLPFNFDHFIQLSETSGEFSLRRLAANNGVGTQIVVLDVSLRDSNQLHGALTSNMISGTGALIEANFDFQRVQNELPAS